MAKYRDGLDAEVDHRIRQAAKHRRQHDAGVHRAERRHRCWECRDETIAIAAAMRRAEDRALFELESSGEQAPRHFRLRAIACALRFGLLPWRLYERECHYEGMSYLAHLGMNLAVAWRWLTGRETNADRNFELDVNCGEADGG